MVRVFESLTEWIQKFFHRQVRGFNKEFQYLGLKFHGGISKTIGFFEIFEKINKIR